MVFVHPSVHCPVVLCCVVHCREGYLTGDLSVVHVCTGRVCVCVMGGCLMAPLARFGPPHPPIPSRDGGVVHAAVLDFSPVGRRGCYREQEHWGVSRPFPEEDKDAKNTGDVDVEDIGRPAESLVHFLFSGRGLLVESCRVVSGPCM